MIEILAIPAFADNYLWLLHRGGHAAAVDPGDAMPVREALRARGLQLDAILITHHHGDHIGGVTGLLADGAVPVFGPLAERDRIPWITQPLEDGAEITVPGIDLRLQVLGVPGHTSGHIAYFAPEKPGENGNLLFCGDTLFAAGCGRLFEGTPAQMHRSLARLSALPGDTAVYCAHEYTLSNLTFARAVEPESAALAAEAARVAALRDTGIPTIPSTIERERRFNPFLRTREPAVRAAVARQAGKPLHDDVDVFATLRKWKDGFRAPAL